MNSTVAEVTVNWNESLTFIMTTSFWFWKRESYDTRFQEPVAYIHTHKHTHTHIGQIIPMGTFLPKKKTALDEINLKRPRRFLLCWHILHCDVILTQLKQHDILTKVNNGFSAGILKKRVNWLKTFLFSFWQWWKLFCANLNEKNVCN